MSVNNMLDASDAPDDGGPRRVRLVVTAAIVGWILLVAGDILTDASEGAGRGHLLVDGLGALLGAGALSALWRGAVLARLRARALALDLGRAAAREEAWRSEAARWRGEAVQALRGLGAAIDAQLERWGLTPAEKEVALLVLKGYGMKDVARMRGTSERTVRQQALTVYKKAGLEGRAELAAFFLEDLLLPGGA